MKTTRAARLIASWSGRRCLAVAIVASLGRNALAADASGDKLDAGVRRIAIDHCGSCHQGSRASANPAALKVFDLRDEDWTARMSDEQVLKLNGRGKSLRPTDRARLTKFVDRVLKNRGASSQ
jgi:mono/diheme cytochrome c family protein